jgi:UDP-N-acetylglucosamine 4,6-dehydratase
MGMSKALMEKVLIAKSRDLAHQALKVCGTRYGNVMASRGSVIPLFVNQVLSGLPITVTDPNMTRFMMTLDDAVDLVLYAFEHANSGDIFVQKAPAATISVLAQAVVELLNKPRHPIKTIGTRHGEKVYETLLSREEIVNADDLGEYYRVPPDMRDLQYDKFFVDGRVNITDAQDYNSHNTRRLNVEETKTLLLKLQFMRDLVEGKTAEPVDG